MDQQPQSETLRPNHILLTVLGIDPRETRYDLNGRQESACLAPIALMRLLPEEEKPNCIVALCTPKAKQNSLPMLKDALESQVPIRCVEVSSGETQEDIDQFLLQVARALPNEERIDLTVDITHGFRHLSFLIYDLVLYVTALRNVRLRNAFYGLLRNDGPSRFLDLRPLIKLPQWFYALRVLRDTGSSLPIAGLLEETPPPGQRDQRRQNAAKRLREVSHAFLSGAPLELGRLASRFFQQSARTLTKTLSREDSLPLAKELVVHLEEILGPVAFEIENGKEGWKQAVRLTKQELQRQVYVIDQLWNHGHIPSALGLMREWTVSWVLWCKGTESNWLENSTRKTAENLLNAIAAISKSEYRELFPKLPDKFQAIAEFWDTLRDLRNAFHHHGMRREDLFGPKYQGDMQGLWGTWEKELREIPHLSWDWFRLLGGSVLVSPIGKRPGVLFSALRVARQATRAQLVRCIVICSSDTRPDIDEAVRRSGSISLDRVVPVVLEDPFADTKAIEEKAKELQPRLFGSDEVFVNVTGGTTLMSLLAQKIADEAQKLALSVRRFGLVDRRPPDRQIADPYQEGTPIWIGEQGPNS